MISCEAHLLSLDAGASPKDVVSSLKDKYEVLVAGIPHGWIHKPHQQDANRLRGHDWHLFVLTAATSEPLESDATTVAHLRIDISITEDQYKHLLCSRATQPKPLPTTPPLAAKWTKPTTGELRIPKSHNLDPVKSPLGPGELRLDSEMTKFLSSALPSTISSKPVSLFNLFKYRNGDSSVHDKYMNDFKQNFGDSAGARVRFMGPVRSGLKQNFADDEASVHRGWQDANLVQYDTIFHYAYMLSTEIYQELNKDKVHGLEDTCILMISEAEIAQPD